MTVAMHNHDNTSDPNEFAKPETFEQVLACRSIAVNPDIGHLLQPTTIRSRPSRSIIRILRTFT
jgi:hypothetical protein